jgi:polyhydroxybutyrate depolymerase
VRTLTALALSLIPLCGCSSSGGGAGGGSSTSGTGGAPVIGGDRPVEVIVPSSLKPGTKVPLVIMLHGYSVNGKVEEVYLQLSALAESRGFLYAHPDGTIDKDGKYFWNATDACCDMYGTMVDDSAYLSSVIDQIKANYPVDPRRVYVLGHSNGGYMSYRMACDHGDQIAAIASLAGAMWQDTSKCKPKGPVSVLEIHGTADDSVAYDGVTGMGAYPGAEATVADWVAIDGCAAAADTSAPPLDLDDTLAGHETKVERWQKGCAMGSSVELWTIAGGHHVPSLTLAFRLDLVEWLLAHPKP